MIGVGALGFHKIYFFFNGGARGEVFTGQDLGRKSLQVCIDYGICEWAKECDCQGSL